MGKKYGTKNRTEKMCIKLAFFGACSVTVVHSLIVKKGMEKASEN